MRYSTEQKFRKYVKGYGFLSFERKFVDKYGQKLMDTATKTGIGTAKTASKRVVQKISEATGDLMGNKIADKITSVGKITSKNGKRKTRNLHTTKKRTADYWWAEIFLTPYKNWIPSNRKLVRYNIW